MKIVANDSNPLAYPLTFSVVSNDQQILQNVFINQTNNQVQIGIAPPGLNRDAPFGRPSYNFALCVTNQNGTGTSSYAAVTINTIDINDNAPIPSSAVMFF